MLDCIRHITVQFSRSLILCFVTVVVVVVVPVLVLLFFALYDALSLSNLDQL